MLQEVVAARTPPPEALALMGRVLGGIAGVVSEGQATGELRTVDPHLAAVSVVSQPLHLTVLTRVMAGGGTMDPGARERLFEHASRFIRASLSTSPEGEKETR